MEVEGVDQLADVILAHQGDDGNLGWGEPLGRSQDHLSSLDLDGALAVTDDTPQSIPFVVGDLSDPDYHARG